MDQRQRSLVGRIIDLSVTLGKAGFPAPGVKSDEDNLKYGQAILSLLQLQGITAQDVVDAATSFTFRGNYPGHAGLYSTLSAAHRELYIAEVVAEQAAVLARSTEEIYP